MGFGSWVVDVQRWLKSERRKSKTKQQTVRG